MNILEVFRQAVDSIRANKLRSSLTLLAISVGVFAVIGSNTAVLVLDTYFKETLTIMGGNVITVQKRPGIRMGGGNWQEFRNRKDITFAQMEELSERGQDIENVGPQENFQVTKVQFAENITEPNVMVRGGNEYFVLHNAYNIEMGRNFTPQDVQNGRNMVIIGHDIFRDLFEGVDPINKEIRIDGRPYQVIGVTESKGAVFGNSQDRFVVAPYTTMLNV
jgi:putative ABC transport system permease protein